jgi:hypothetical protein
MTIPERIPSLPGIYCQAIYNYSIYVPPVAIPYVTVYNN